MKGMSFNQTFAALCRHMRSAPEVVTERWQGVDATKNPALATHEMTFVEFEVDLRGHEDLDHWRRDIGPNLPWADDHFLERVGGSPLNPGREWANWPWAASAERFRDSGKIFNHTYAERLWPRFPRSGDGGDYSSAPQKPGDLRKQPRVRSAGVRGIGWKYGDLQDLVDLIANEPCTRQAYIPMFFPEDTGVGDGGRKPCSLGWQFLVRDNKISVFYPMRSVDLRRHFRDDCYLCVRLLLWVLDRCRERGDKKFWAGVVPGTYAMWMGSLHVFKNDHGELVRDGGWK